MSNSICYFPSKCVVSQFQSENDDAHLHFSARSLFDRISRIKHGKNKLTKWQAVICINSSSVKCRTKSSYVLNGKWNEKCDRFFSISHSKAFEWCWFMDVRWVGSFIQTLVCLFSTFVHFRSYLKCCHVEFIQPPYHSFVSHRHQIENETNPPHPFR